MLQRLTRAVLLGLVLASTAWPAQQTPPGSPPSPSQDGKDSGKPQPRGKSTGARMQDTDAPPTPASPEEDIEVAQYYIRKGDPDAAIPRLEEAIQLKPNLAKPRLMLAEVYEKKDDAPDAIKCYKEYLGVFPSAPDAKKVQKKIEKLESR